MAVSGTATRAAERRIEYLYEIGSVRLVKRNRLTAEQTGYVNLHKQSDFWLIKLGGSKLLPVAFSAGGIRKFRFRLTGASDLLAAHNWSHLSERYASFVETSSSSL